MIDEYDNETETMIVLGGGRVEYSATDAAVEINDLIAALEDAKNEGATHVVMSSGNYRGAQWQSIATNYSWASEQ